MYPFGKPECHHYYEIVKAQNKALEGDECISKSISKSFNELLPIFLKKENYPRVADIEQLSTFSTICSDAFKSAADKSKESVDNLKEIIQERKNVTSLRTKQRKLKEKIESIESKINKIDDKIAKSESFNSEISSLHEQRNQYAQSLDKGRLEHQQASELLAEETRKYQIFLVKLLSNEFFNISRAKLESGTMASMFGSELAKISHDLFTDSSLDIFKDTKDDVLEREINELAYELNH